MHFQKQDLEGTFYNWVEEGRNIFSGQPSRRTFDSSNGAQVLFMINFYGSLSERFTLSEGRQLEQKILNELPADAKSELSVFNWLRKNS